jgi:hypothetical protein
MELFGDWQQGAWFPKSEPSAASVTNIENCFIRSNVDFTLASGWLEREAV